MATVTAPAPAELPASAAAPAAAAPAPTQNSSLYVGDLDREVTEAQLFELFAAVGPVASIRVCRDAVTRRSLGYAYVNFNGALDASAATRALDALNFTPVNGKPIRIMWSQRDPSARKSAVGNIFIKNLDKSIDNKSLHDTFADFGKILSCKVATDAMGQSRGYGFVHFEEQGSAEQAIALVNGKMIEDKIVTVCPFLKRTDRPAGKEVFTNVYLKNLPTETTDEELAKLVAEFGEFSSAVVQKDDKGGSKGFGFVNFNEADSAQACVEALNGKEVGGKVLFASKAQKKTEREAVLKQKADEIRQERIAKFQGMNLYVKNLVDEVDDDLLREQFESFGTIVSCKVMKDSAGKSKGFGFVCFTTSDEATSAVTAMNGKMLKGKPLYVALAQRKDARKAQLEASLNQSRMQQARPQGPMGVMPYGPAGAMPYFAGGPAGMPPARPGFGYPGMQMGPRGMAAPGGRGPRPMLGPAPGFGAPPMIMGGPGGRGRGGRGGRGMMGNGSEMGPYGMGPMGPYGMVPNGYGNPNMQGYPPQQGYPQQGYPQAYPGPPQGYPQQSPPQGFQGRGRGRGPAGKPPGPPPPNGGRGRGPVPPPPPANPANQAAPAPPPAGPAPVVDLSSVPLSASVLASATPEQQQQMIGERLYPEVAKLQPELAGKITGMLLEMEKSELLLLLEDSEALQAKVDEAISVLKQHNIVAEGAAPDATA